MLYMPRPSEIARMGCRGERKAIFARQNAENNYSEIEREGVARTLRFGITGSEILEYINSRLSAEIFPS